MLTMDFSNTAKNSNKGLKQFLLEKMLYYCLHIFLKLQVWFVGFHNLGQHFMMIYQYKYNNDIIVTIIIISIQI